MRIVYIKLKGYIGIYNGLGLNELEIDMSNSKHKITLIAGINGCGKSTLMNALSILPDNSSNFTPGVPAEKSIKLLDNDILYDITISSATSKAGRGVSKASIKKNGIELNPNGNITSYKEIIYQEFDLDPSFLTLTKLASDDRGMAEKSPAERKKLLSFLVESMETYNGIFKILNSKSRIFKSYVNNLHTKIQNTGDEDNLRYTLSSLEARKNSIESNINGLRSSIVESQTIITMNDPDGSMQSRYELAEKELSESSLFLKKVERMFFSICDSLRIDHSMEAVLNFISEKDSLIKSYTQNLQDSNRRKLDLIEKSEAIISEINSKQIKLSEISKGINLGLKNAITVLTNKINEEKIILSRLGIIDISNTSEDELQYSLDIIRETVEMIEIRLYSDCDESMMRYILDFYPDDILELESKINEQKSLVESLRLRTMETEKDFELINILSNRPSNCSIDSCYFIENAHKLKESKYGGVSVQKKLEELLVELNEATDYLGILSNKYEALSFISHKRMILDQIRDTIIKNTRILQKCSIGKLFISTFDSKIASLSPFNEFKDLDDLISEINTITIYKQDIERLRNLEAEWLKQSNSETFARQLEEEIELLKESSSKVSKELSSINTEINNYTSILENLTSKYNIACQAKEKGETWINETQRNLQAKAVYDDIVSKSKASISILEKISNMNAEIIRLQTEINPLEAQIQKISGQLIMLESYKEEYTMYSEKSNTVETLKKYCSPTTGIQTIFMNLYMSKTLDLANEVLGMLFKGQYRFLDYVINATEFRIPFVGLGLPVDDISSGSTSQVCMMGLVMNLVLLYQASTKYNIPRLDEIDGGLDTMNRMEFVNVLYKISDILGIEQTFIISHSLELELSNVDIIKLKTYDGFESPEGNILYEFKG